MTKPTVGKVSSDLLSQQTHAISPIEQMQENLTDYEQNIWECIHRCKKDFPADFFVVVITKNERLMPNVFRNFFYGRLSCPTPDYDQTVYKYSANDDAVDFVWVIPSRDASIYLKNNALQVTESERGLLKFVLDFADGTLFTLAKKYNGEKENSVELQSYEG